MATPALAQRVAVQGRQGLPCALAKPVATESPAGQGRGGGVLLPTAAPTASTPLSRCFNAWIKAASQGPCHGAPHARGLQCQNFVPMQKPVLHLEGMGKLDKLHAKVFKAIHEERLQADHRAGHPGLGGKAGREPRPVQEHLQRRRRQASEKAIGLQEAYQVEGTPAMGVAGRFYRGGQGPRTLLVADIADRRGPQGLSFPASCAANQARCLRARAFRREQTHADGSETAFCAATMNARFVPSMKAMPQHTTSHRSFCLVVCRGP